MSEIDDMVQRTVEWVAVIARRASRFAGRLLAMTVLACVGGFWLGLEALSGGIETVWIVLGVTFGSLAIGSAFVAWWRVSSVKRHVPALADEVRSLVQQGYDPSNTVIDTFEVHDQPGERTSSTIVMSREMGGFRSQVLRAPGSYEQLSAATKAITSFPFLAIGAVLISMVFAFLGFIFLIALAL